MSSINATAVIESLSYLSYRELQDECKKANLSAGGKTEDLRKRLRGLLSRKHGTDNNEDNAPPSKRAKKSPSDDLKCPITLELPFDPVTAEDGRVYERAAILSHFERHPTGVKSPVTNLKMGRRLLPAVQTKNLIETLIETGAIEGDLADSWTKKEEERKKVEYLKKKAVSGNANAMYKVGRLYERGEKGVTKDSKLAYQWFKKAADAENVKAMAVVGTCLVVGEGVEQNKMQGMMFLTIAAERGSDFACYHLGFWFADGSFGFPTDTSQDIRWLRKALSGDCSHRHLSQDSIIEARSKLQELEGDNNDSSTTLA